MNRAMMLSRRRKNEPGNFPDHRPLRRVCTTVSCTPTVIVTTSSGVPSSRSINAHLDASALAAILTEAKPRSRASPNRATCASRGSAFLQIDPRPFIPS